MRKFKALLSAGLFLPIVLVAAADRAAASEAAQGTCTRDLAGIPAAIKAVFRKPAYRNAVWGLRVDDLATGRTLINHNPSCNLYIGSVRKVFTIGQLLDEVGPNHRYDTPIHRRGTVDKSGVLAGDLILVASGDLTMGGRTNPDGSVAFTAFDHNEANSLANAVLAKPDPLAGYKRLADQVARSGIKRVAGDVVIDDRLFQPYLFRDEFKVRPIFVNDDVVDVSMRPTRPGQLASVFVRPRSPALRIETKVKTGKAGSPLAITIDPELPRCIGKPGCTATVAGSLPVDLVPPLTGKLPLVRTVRIVEPANYARTVLIRLLRNRGVAVDADPEKPNPIGRLPADRHYPASTKVAELTGLRSSQNAKFVLKVSYNIGADTSLLLFGLTQGVDNMKASLAQERRNLASRYGIPATQYDFVDGSGGGETRALNKAVTRMLTAMTRSPAFPAFRDALPILGVDGSLAMVTDYEADPTLAGATGRVRAKTGTFVDGSDAGLVLKGQAFGGYITTKSGRRLVYQLAVNNVPISEVLDVVQVFQDEGRVSAILWRDY